MVRNDAKGKVVGRDPGKSIEIVRNPNWDASTDFRPAYLDEIEIEEGNDDLTVASRRTLQGEDLHVLRLGPAADRDPAADADVREVAARAAPPAAARAGSRSARTRSRSTTSTSARP